MGRLAAYLGPEAPVSSLVEGGSYSLLKQSDIETGGFGLGWYPADDVRAPVRVRARESLRASLHVLEVPRRYPSRCVLAGLGTTQPHELGGTQPLHRGRYMFAQAGTLKSFRQVFLRPLLAELSEAQFRTLSGLTRAEVLFGLWLDALDGEGPEAMAQALERVLSRVQQMATDADAPASLALLLTDGEGLVAVRTGTHGPPPPLYTVLAAEGAPLPATARVVASEPTFPGAWEPIEAHALTLFSVVEDGDMVPPSGVSPSVPPL